MTFLQYCVALQQIFFNLINKLKSSSFQEGIQLGEKKEVSLSKVWWARRNALGHWHDGATIYFPSTNQAFFSSLPLSDFSTPADNIPCSPSGHKVEVYDEWHPYNQKT